MSTAIRPGFWTEGRERQNDHPSLLPAADARTESFLQQMSSGDADDLLHGLDFVSGERQEGWQLGWR